MTTPTATAPSARRASIYRAGKFGAVGIVGLGVNLVAQATLTELASFNYLVAAIAATQVSSTCNFLLADRLVFDASGAHSGGWRRYGSFLAMNNAALLFRGPLMWIFTEGAGLHYALSNLASLVLMTLVRFAIADRIIWGSRPAPSVENATGWSTAP